MGQHGHGIAMALDVAPYQRHGIVIQAALFFHEPVLRVDPLFDVGLLGLVEDR